MSYEIRACRPGDIGAVVSLCAKHATHERAFYDPSGKIEALNKSIFCEQPVLYCWVVSNEETIIGYCSFTRDFSTWDASYYLHLDCLYLEPICRGLGIGKQILDKLVTYARETQCVNVQWQTPDFNDSAIKFYENFGATPRTKLRFTYAVT